MKVNSLFLCILVLALVSQALAAFTQSDSVKAATNCNGGSFIGTEVFGKDLGKARNNAKAEITSNIISQVKSEIKMSNSIYNNHFNALVLMIPFIFCSGRISSIVKSNFGCWSSIASNGRSSLFKIPSFSVLNET